MELLILVLYDAIAVGILLLSVNKASREGFARTATAFVGRIAAFFASLFIGKAGSQIIYKLFLGKRIRTFIRDAVADSATVQDIVESIESAADTLPDFVANLYGLGDVDSFVDALNGSVFDVAAALEKQLIQPALTGFIHIVLFLISFAVLSILVHNFAKAVGFVFKLPIIHSLDRFMGAILGVIQGGINLYLICLAVRFVLYFISDPPALLNEGLIMDTFLWSRIYQFNPFTFLN